MPFFRDGIENVQVCALPDGVAGDGGCAVVSAAALVTWRSSQAGMLHQVYLNGRFAGVTCAAEQRRLVVQSPIVSPTAVRVTVIAVAPTDAHLDFSDALGQAAVSSGRVRLTLLRSQTLPLGTTADIYHDNGTGQIDYATPVNAAPIPLWPCLHEKAGLGTAQFGTGDFGYDSAASIGFGKGALGRGQFGLDADCLEWISPALPLGTYRLGVRIADADGNLSPAVETGPVPVVAAARPATGLDVASFDPHTHQLTLTVTP
ncbi:MAG: hypothetical protein JW955_17925 [Sedimentisphaerales bacterium]|nr:hypothetical protein [Sedimentisphaerales bacterium]